MTTCETPNLSDLKRAYLAHHFSGNCSAKGVLEQLGAIQIDPISIVAPNQVLVAAARITSGDASCFDGLYHGSLAIETYAKERCIIPAERAPYFAPLIEQRREKLKDQLTEHSAELDAVMDVVRERTSVAASDLKSRSIERGDNWGPRKLHTLLLNLLWQTGQIIVDSRRDGETYYAPAPDGLWASPDTNSLSPDELRLRRWKYYLDGAGIIDSRDTFAGYERASAKDRAMMLNTLAETGYADFVEAREGRIVTVVSKNLSYDGTPRGSVQPRFVPPLDNAIWNRALVEDLFDFRYRWEIYVPPARRVFGAYAMPLMTDSGLFGPVDMRFDKRSRSLRLALKNSPLHRAPEKIRSAVEEAAQSLADFLEAERIEFV